MRTALLAAQEWGTDPVADILGPVRAGMLSAEEHWQLRVKLQVAMRVLKEETCPECGYPIWLCHSSLDTVQWEVEWSTCYANAAVEEAKKLQENKRHLSSGETPHAVFDHELGDWPTRQAGLESM